MANDGFDDAIDKLDELSERAQELDGENEVPINELFSDGFMQRYTGFDSIDEFFDQSPWTVESEDDLEAIPDEEMDDYVNEHTQFSNSEKMQEKAAEEWTKDQLGL